MKRMQSPIQTPEELQRAWQKLRAEMGEIQLPELTTSLQDRAGEIKSRAVRDLGSWRRRKRVKQK